MLVLGIESTCDETAAAVVKEGRTILSNVISSQADLHSIYGGVVPELACRRHVDVILPIIDQALQEAAVSLDAINLIAVAYKPGLIGALLIGLTCAKTLALAKNIPFVGVNHTEAHLYAALMSQQEAPPFPALGVVLSGGHTALLKMETISTYTLLSTTRDDAVGEAFDKAAKMMGLPYPGGPPLEKLATTGNPHRYPLKAGQVKGEPLGFSFSGLKTAVLRAYDTTNSADVAASFQQAAFADIIDKIQLACKLHNLHCVIMGGGVTNSQTLRKMCKERAPHLTFIWPLGTLTLDNAAMIAGMGFHQFQKNPCTDSLDLEAAAQIPWSCN